MYREPATSHTTLRGSLKEAVDTGDPSVAPATPVPPNVRVVTGVGEDPGPLITRTRLLPLSATNLLQPHFTARRAQTQAAHRVPSYTEMIKMLRC